MIADEQLMALIYRHGGSIEHRINAMEDTLLTVDELRETMEDIQAELEDVKSTEDLGSRYMAAYRLAREIQDAIVQEMTAYVGNGQYVR